VGWSWRNHWGWSIVWVSQSGGLGRTGSTNCWVGQGRYVEETFGDGSNQLGGSLVQVLDICL